MASYSSRAYGLQLFLLVTLLHHCISQDSAVDSVINSTVATPFNLSMYVPASLISIILLTLVALMAVGTATCINYVHSLREANRDDVSDISEHTREMLRKTMRATRLGTEAFRIETEKSKEEKEEDAKKIASDWASRFKKKKGVDGGGGFAGFKLKKDVDKNHNEDKNQSDANKDNNKLEKDDVKPTTKDKNEKTSNDNDLKGEDKSETSASTANQKESDSKPHVAVAMENEDNGITKASIDEKTVPKPQSAKGGKKQQKTNQIIPELKRAFSGDSSGSVTNVRPNSSKIGSRQSQISNINSISNVEIQDLEV